MSIQEGVLAFRNAFSPRAFMMFRKKIENKLSKDT